VGLEEGRGWMFPARRAAAKGHGGSDAAETRA